MTTSFADATVSGFLGGLNALKAIVDAASSHVKAKEIAPEALLEARLFPDMFTFTRQINSATVAACRAVDRLSGKEPENADAPESTFEAIVAHIDAAIAHVEAADRAAIDDSESRAFKAPMGPKIKLSFTGRSYVAGFAQPNFLFHVVTAYNILRHNGIEVGKRDYLGPFIGLLSTPASDES